MNTTPATTNAAEMIELVLDQAVEAYIDLQACKARNNGGAQGILTGLTIALQAMLSGEATPADELIRNTAEQAMS